MALKIVIVGAGEVGFNLSKVLSKEGYNLTIIDIDPRKCNRVNNNIDAIITHAPGTIHGDTAELSAIYKVFGDIHPILLSNKWMIGHTFGASAALSLELGIHILHNQKYSDFPYSVRVSFEKKEIKNIMINAAGFGGNCASLIISR